MTQQQLGQALSCDQVVGRQIKVCDDAQLSGWICCASCRALLLQYESERGRQLVSYAPQMARARRLLLGPGGGNARFRSPPLHGSGDGMPLLALGTNGLTGRQGVDQLQFALQVGYRHLDSAIMYENHGAVSQALEKSGVLREEVFITSKVPPDMMGFRGATEAVEKIRAELPGGYADLCLVHWPHAEGASGSVERTVVERAGTWRALEEAFDAGACRAIGVSNFMVKHLEELRHYARVQPSVNQLEYSPLAPLAELAEHCGHHGIVLQAFGWHRPHVLEHPSVSQAALEVGRPAAQVLARWFLQRGHTPLYMTRRPERLLEHAEAVGEDWGLSEAQLAEIGREPLPDYPWRHYTGGSQPAPWSTPVMADAAGACGAGTDA